MDSDRLAVVEALTEKNAEAINTLALTTSKNIDKLTLNMEKAISAFTNQQDKMSSKIDKLFEDRIKYQYEIEAVYEKIEAKRTRLNKIEDKLKNKISKDHFEDKLENIEISIKELKSFIHKTLWWLFGSIFGILAFLLKEIFFK